MYYDLVSGWLMRQEWSEYLAFHSKTRSMIRLNRIAYDILHSLIGRSIEEATRVLAKNYSIGTQEASWVTETAYTLVDQRLLSTSPTRPTLSPEDLDAITVPDTSYFGLGFGATDRLYYQTPASVLWSLTNRCNLQCKYCAPESGPVASPDLTLSELIQIQEELSKHRVFEVIITGGEALLRRSDVFHLLERLHARNHFVHLLSNGMLIDDNIGERLADLKIGIGVSLDGPTDVINSATRGPRNFKRVTEALRQIVRKGVWTNVLTVLTRFNFDALDDHFALLEEIGIKYLVLQPLRPSGRAQETFELLRPTEDQLRELPEKLGRLKERFPEINVDDYEVRFWGDLLLVTDFPNREPRKLLSCGAGVRFCVVDAKGEVTPCNALLDIPCGNLLHQSLPDIWHYSVPLQELRILAGKSVCVISPCSSCRFNVICDGGCRADAFHATGYWIGLHPFCLGPLGSPSENTGKVDSEKSPRESKPVVEKEAIDRSLGSIVSH